MKESQWDHPPLRLSLFFPPPSNLKCRTHFPGDSHGYIMSLKEMYLHLITSLLYKIFLHVALGCLFTELGFLVGSSSWIFELDFRVRIFWRDFFLYVGFPVNFQWFYTTYFISGLAHRLEVFPRWRRIRIADR